MYPPLHGMRGWSKWLHYKCLQLRPKRLSNRLQEAWPGFAPRRGDQPVPAMANGKRRREPSGMTLCAEALKSAICRSHTIGNKVGCQNFTNASFSTITFSDSSRALTRGIRTSRARSSFVCTHKDLCALAIKYRHVPVSPERSNSSRIALSCNDFDCRCGATDPTFSQFSVRSDLDGCSAARASPGSGPL
jgi:hypothetical protein